MSWRQKLLPASFRGARFHVLSHEAGSGRRTVTHEYPLRDTPMGEDLGRLKCSYSLQAFVLGDDYMVDRDALIAACNGKAAPGNLMHPWLGELRVRCETIAWKENIKEGGYCAFDIKFVEAEPEDDSSPKKLGSSLSGTLAGIQRALAVARAAFAIARLVAGNPDFLRRAALSAIVGWGGAIAGRFLGLPGLDLSDIALATRTLGVPNPGQGAAGLALATPDPAQDAPTALAITNAALAVAMAAPLPVPEAAPNQALGSRGAVADAASLPARAAALLALAPVIPAASPDAATAQAMAAIAALCSDALVLAAAHAAVVAEYPSADAVAATRTALLAGLLERRDAAAERGADAVFLALTEVLATVGADLAARSAALPRLARYRLDAALPSLALAQRLYAAPGQADALVALNDAPHPAFMPPAGVALRP